MPAKFSLRARLREDTRSCHETLDNIVTGFDIASRTGLTRFLLMQASGMSGLREAVAGTPSQSAIADLTARAEEDLRVLGFEGQRPRVRDLDDLHPLAAEYILGGSRLGTVVLKERWRSASDDAVRLARHYFDAEDYQDIWKRFSLEAQRRDGSDSLADRVVADARRVFQNFTDCAMQAKRIEVPPHD